jgi:Mannosyltransferase (PIG-V)
VPVSTSHTDHVLLTQIPNFLLATPTALIATGAIWSYAAKNPGAVFTVGHLLPSAWVNQLLPSTCKLQTKEIKSGFASDATFVYVAQLFGMLAIGMLFVHIQVRGLWRSLNRYVLFGTSCALLVQELRVNDLLEQRNDLWRKSTLLLYLLEEKSTLQLCTRSSYFAGIDQVAHVLPSALLVHGRHLLDRQRWIRVLADRLLFVVGLVRVGSVSQLLSVDMTVVAVRSSVHGRD